MEETFTYDDMDRLTGVSLGTAPSGAMAYDGYGRMTSKTAGGNPVFSNAVFDADSKLHAMDQNEKRMTSVILFCGATCRTRTNDLRITNALLYQLS